MFGGGKIERCIGLGRKSMCLYRLVFLEDDHGPKEVCRNLGVECKTHNKHANTTTPPKNKEKRHEK